MFPTRSPFNGKGGGGRGPLSIKKTPSHTFVQLLKSNEQLRVSTVK
ncbi:hypothetical protein DFP93_107154 [Aneurinibacillus soli]|uniref:Uncharacterized protein n=1 Tax=Aneurinibacillus soli TaxID=1500254 RepID=A0A0U4WID0_9BACL|nr:hypothetical protein DFP93_107154 [Aneurinibacillus soli]BAU28379.1 hypothetical protein CB4_02553 [Aneurinibacillus soli]